MRTYIMAGAVALLLAGPALGQTVTRETTTTREYTEPAPLLVQPAPPAYVAAPPLVVPMPGSAYESQMTTQYGDSGMSRTETRTDRYIGTDGALHTDRVIQQVR